MFCTAIVGFSQVKLDYTAKPKAEAKGFSAKGLSATSAQFLYQLKQAEATTDRSAKASAYAKLQREYDLVQGKVPAIQVNQRLKAKISTRCLNVTGSQDCSILLSTSGSETTDFTTVLGTHTYLAMEDVDFSLPLDNFKGQTVRIAVRHHNCATLAATLFLNGFSIEVAEDSVFVPSYVDAMGYMVTTNGLQLYISGAEGHSLEIYDLTGRLVMSNRNADGNYRLPSSGMYILRVNGFKPRKVMVMGR